ncbi:hypothetical protein MKEN_00501200 [Mycena kentingensis (nom. inval.)]|nr:hypothetical protein MKEN_00501200 [Mycena kentingensis (nom. inval.)]
MGYYAYGPPPTITPSVAYVNPSSPSQVCSSGPPLATWSSPGTTVMQYANGRLQFDETPGAKHVTLSPRLTNLRAISTPPEKAASAPPPSPEEDAAAQATHFKITLRRSAISLGDKKKGTLAALGLYRRHQTVFHPHKPDIAGKILAVKELVEVANVPAAAVRSKEAQRKERKAPKGYEVVGSKMGGMEGV